MDSGLKQRLIGAVVLVALAVIFLPMLLDGSGARERLNEDIAIPEQPEAPESRLDRDGTGAKSGGAANGDAAEATLATDEFGDGEAGRTDDAASQTASNPDEESTAQTSAEASADDGGGNDEGRDDEARDQARAEGWIVQVGSFQRETNALVLRDRLREDGFDATTEQVETDGGTLWRVWLGPVAGREEGEALENRIEDHRGSDALLMEYSR